MKFLGSIVTFMLLAKHFAMAHQSHDHPHDHQHDHPHHTGNGNVVESVHELEKMYIEDCQLNDAPHGFYGSFFQPCEFSFFEVNTEEESSSYEAANSFSCSSDASTLVGKPVPVHWFFKITEHIDKDDWDDLSSDDIPDFDDLMLWPDQCVGVSPRCYELGKNEAISETLQSLFPDGIPEGSTHVQVDCRADAMELSNVVYSFASGAEKSIPTLVAWMVTVLLLFLVAMAYCFYGCFWICCGREKRAHAKYQPVPAVLVEDEGCLETQLTPLKKYNA